VQYLPSLHAKKAAADVTSNVLNPSDMKLVEMQRWFSAGPFHGGWPLSVLARKDGQHQDPWGCSNFPSCSVEPGWEYLAPGGDL